MRKLAPMQERFVAEYLKDLNATQAALRAGYSKNTAGVIAYQLLQKPLVVDAIQAAKQKRSAETGIDARWLLDQLRMIYEADIADIVDDLGKFKPIKEWPKVWRKMLQGCDIQELWEGSGKDRRKLGEVVKIKFTDTLKNLEMIGRHIGVNAFKELHEHTGKDGGPIETKGSVRIEFIHPGAEPIITLGDGSDADGGPSEGR